MQPADGSHHTAVVVTRNGNGDGACCAQVAWQRWSKTSDRPADIPSSPDQVYRAEGWLSWGDWLGYAPGQPPRQTIFLPFEEAREYARALGFTSTKQWERWNRCDAAAAAAAVIC